MVGVSSIISGSELFPSQECKENGVSCSILLVIYWVSSSCLTIPELKHPLRTLSGVFLMTVIILNVFLSLSQARDDILNGSHPVSFDKACEFAGIQAQIQFGPHIEHKHKPGFLE